MQEDLVLKYFSQCHSTIEFRRQVPENKYPQHKKTRARLISVFSQAHCCESLFSVMNFVKSKHRATLTDEHLQKLIRTALTTCRLNFQRLASQEQDYIDNQLGLLCHYCCYVILCRLILLLAGAYGFPQAAFSLTNFAHPCVRAC